jgi:hypothetical protein
MANPTKQSNEICLKVLACASSYAESASGQVGVDHLTRDFNVSWESLENRSKCRAV